MIRRLMPCLLLVSVLPAAAQTPAEQKAATEQGTKPAAVVCVYNSRNYSEGATVCVQKAAMQACTADNGKAVWVAVTDETLSRRCTASARRLDKYQRAAIRNRRNIARQISPPANGSPRCFDATGKQLCE